MAWVYLSSMEMGLSPKAGREDGHVDTSAHFFVLPLVDAEVTCTLRTGIVSASIFLALPGAGGHCMGYAEWVAAVRGAAM